MSCGNMRLRLLYNLNRLSKWKATLASKRRFDLESSPDLRLEWVGSLRKQLYSTKMEKVVLVTRRSQRPSRIAAPAEPFVRNTTNSLQFTPRKHYSVIGPKPSVMRLSGTVFGMTGMRQVYVLNERQKTLRHRLRISTTCLSLAFWFNFPAYSLQVSRQILRKGFCLIISFLSRGMMRLKTTPRDSLGLLAQILPQKFISSQRADISAHYQSYNGSWPNSKRPNSYSMISSALFGFLSMALIQIYLVRKMIFLKVRELLDLGTNALLMKEKKPSSSLREVSLRVIRALLLLSSFSMAQSSYFLIRSNKISSWSSTLSYYYVISTILWSSTSTPKPIPTYSNTCPTLRRQSLLTVIFLAPLQYPTDTSWYLLCSSSKGSRAQSNLPLSFISRSRRRSRVSKEVSGSRQIRSLARLKALKHSSARFLPAHSLRKPSIWATLELRTILQIPQCASPQRQAASFLSSLPEMQSFFLQRYSMREGTILYLLIQRKGCSAMVGCLKRKLKNYQKRQARTQQVLVFFLPSVKAFIYLVSGSIQGNWMPGYSSRSYFRRSTT